MENISITCNYWGSLHTSMLVFCYLNKSYPCIVSATFMRLATHSFTAGNRLLGGQAA